jgi:hypothetical protein
MRCPICADFERALEDRTSEYHKACSSTVYCRISSRFADYSEIEMARAQSELEIHRSVCASAVTEDRPRQVALVATTADAPEPALSGVEGSRF